MNESLESDISLVEAQESTVTQPTTPVKKKLSWKDQQRTNGAASKHSKQHFGNAKVSRVGRGAARGR